MKQKSAVKQATLRQQIIVACMVLSVLAAIGLIWQFSPLSDNVTPEKFSEKIQQFKNYPWAPMMMIGVFVAGGICFLPLTVLTVATAMTFGPILGIFISLTGAISSAMMTYGMGYFLGKKLLRKWIGHLCEKLQPRIAKTVLGMAALRLVLVTPYTMDNIALGMLAVHFPTFVAGSFLALIPSAIIRSVLGDTLMDFWRNPDSKNLAYIVAGIAGWVVIVLLLQASARKWSL